MNFIFEQIQTGGDRNFGYLIGDRASKEAILVDPSYAPEKLVERTKAQGLTVKWIINTHGHHDHTNGNDLAKELTGAPIAIHKSSEVPHDVDLDEGQPLQLGEVFVKVLFTPGHCSDHITLYLPQYQIALTGDLLFVGKIGGTWSDEDAKIEFESLQRLLNELPPETTIWPGHNYGCRPSSTIALERAVNPFLEPQDFDGFCRIKEGWRELKIENGLY